jgi:hypothetical protein
MMLDDVAAVETAGRPPTRSPDTKAAINYLIASGATAISVIETEAGCTFRIGAKLLARSVAIFWIMEVDAKPVVTSARKIAGKGAGGDAAVAALHRAATDLRAVLTPNDVAMTRAGNAAAKLDRYLDSLQGSGALREFTRMYKRRRTEAKAAGAGLHDVQERRAAAPSRIGPAARQRAKCRAGAIAFRGNFRRRLIEPGALGDISRGRFQADGRCSLVQKKCNGVAGSEHSSQK